MGSGERGEEGVVIMCVNSWGGVEEGGGET